MKNTNNVLIGNNAGSELPEGLRNVVIIGDDVTSLDHSQENVTFIGDKVAIGERLFGNKLNLRELINPGINN